MKNKQEEPKHPPIECPEYDFVGQCKHTYPPKAKGKHCLGGHPKAAM